MGTNSKGHEVLCKPVFPDMQTLQGSKIKSNHKNNIMVQCSTGDIFLDCCITIHDGWEAGVKFLQETGHKRAQIANAFTKRDINDLHDKVGHPSEVITYATAKSVFIYLTSTFKP